MKMSFTSRINTRLLAKKALACLTNTFSSLDLISLLPADLQDSPPDSPSTRLLSRPQQASAVQRTINSKCKAYDLTFTRLFSRLAWRTIFELGWNVCTTGPSPVRVGQSG